MSLLDDINSRISQLQAATDANYKAAGYTIPTASQRKVAEMSGQNPYEYATQLKQAEQAQKEAEKAAKAMQKQAERAARQSSRSSGTASRSKRKTSISQSSDDVEEQQTTERQTIPSIANVQKQEAAWKDQAIKQLKTPQKQSSEKQREQPAKESTATTKAETNTQPVNISTPPSSKSFETDLYNIRNAEMAAKKVQEDAIKNPQNNFVGVVNDSNSLPINSPLPKLTEKSYQTNDHRLSLDKQTAPILDPLNNALTRDPRTQEYEAPVDINTSNYMDYLGTDRVLTNSEEKGANAFVEHYKSNHEKYEQVAKDLKSLRDKVENPYTRNFTDITKERQKIVEDNDITWGELQEYQNVYALENKLSDMAALGAGLSRIDDNILQLEYNIGDSIARTADSLTPSFLMSDEEKKKREQERSLRNIEDARYKEAKEATANQNPIAYTAGNFGYQTALTAMSGGLLAGSGAVNYIGNMMGGSALAKAIAETGLETLLVDIPTDTIPEAIENYNNGMPLDQVISNAGWNVLGNAGLNAVMDMGAPYLRGDFSKAIGDQADTLAKSTDDLIPGMNTTDNLLRNTSDVTGSTDDELITSLIKQQEDAAQNIEELSKQLPPVDEGKITYTTAQDQAIPPKAPETTPNASTYDDFIKEIDNAQSDQDIISIMSRAADANRQGVITDDQIESLIDYWQNSNRVANIPSADVANTTMRTGFDTVVPEYNVTVGDMVADYAETMKQSVTDWGTRHADLINSNDLVRESYDNLNKAVDDYIDAALHSDDNLDVYYRSIDNKRKKLSRVAMTVDEVAAKDKALGNSNVSILKNADRARYAINDNIKVYDPNESLDYIPGAEGLTRADADSMFVGDAPILTQKPISLSEARHKSQDILTAEKNNINNQLNQLLGGTMSSDKLVEIGQTPDILLKVGAPDAPLKMSQSTVFKIAYPDGYMGGKHNLGFKSLEMLPEQLDNPLAIMKSNTHPDNSVVILTEMIDANNNPVIVPIQINKQGVVDVYNNVSSAYGRTNIDSFLEDARNSGRMLFEDKNRIDSLSVNGLQLPEITADNDPIFKTDASINNITDTSEKVNTDIPKNTTSSMAESTGIDNAARSSVEIPAESSKMSAPKGTDGTGGTNGPDMRQRGYDKTYQSGRTNIQEGLKSEPEMYEVRHNADTQKAADEIWNSSKSLDDTETKARSLISQGDATAVPLTSKLINEYARTGDTNKAVDLLNQLEEKMTKSGQFTQAAKMTIIQNNPEVAKTYLQRQIDLLNQSGKQKFKGKWKNFELTEDELKAFDNITTGDVDGISDLYAQIGKRMGSEMPVSFANKLNEYRKLNMLFNPRTHIRNVASNTIMVPVREATDRVSAIGQNTYKLFHKDYEVTQSVLPPSSADRKLAGTIYDAEIAPRLDGSKYAEQAKGMDAFNKAFNENKQIFRDSKVGSLTNEILFSDNSILNKISGGKLADAVREGKITGSNLENLRRFDYYLLGELEDNPFVKANFDSRLGSYIKAQKIKNAADIPPEIIEVAYQEALKATFKDDNVLSDALGGVRNVLNKYSGNLIGDALFPFTKTPAAIAMRGIDYSPVGFIPSIAKYANSDHNAIDISNLFDDLSKNVTGTLAIAAGFALAKNGIITGPLSNNTREKQFQQAQGMQAYSIKIGDRYYSYDWAQPSAIPFILGATMYNAMAEDDAELSNVLYGGFEATTNAWINLSPLQTIADVFGSGNYTGSFASGLKDAAISYTGSYVPSVVGATARAVDNNYRVTHNNESMLDAARNQLTAKLPGLSKTLPKSYDMWGRERKRSENGLESVFSQFVNPGQLSVSNPSPIDKEVQRLHDATGENSVYPNKATWSVDLGNGKTKKLTNEEYSDYQREMGSTSYKLANEFIKKNDLYKDITDANKAEVLSSIYSLAKAQAESKLFGKEISEGSTNYKLNEIYEKEGEKGLIEYLSKNALIRDTGAEANDTTRKVFDEGISVKGKTVKGQEGVIMYQEASEYLKENGMTNNAKNRQMYYDGQTGDLEQKQAAYDAFEAYGLDKNDTNMKIYNDYGGEKGLEQLKTLGSTSAFYTYQSALKEHYTVPSIADYAKTYSAIDSDKNGSVSQAEMKSYLNRGNYTEKEATKIASLYGDWTKQPYVTSNGTWSFK